jgi:hypothetical protein
MESVSLDSSSLDFSFSVLGAFRATITVRGAIRATRKPRPLLTWSASIERGPFRFILVERIFLSVLGNVGFTARPHRRSDLHYSATLL